MEDRDDSFSDISGGIERIRRRRPQESEADDSPGAGSQPEIFDADRQLPGAVLMVPNDHWGFRNESSDDHPGACAEYRPGANVATMVKGTDAEHVEGRPDHFFVDASKGNGLKKRTAFELFRRRFRLHRLKLLFAERYLGRLEPQVLKDLQAELARVHPED